MRCGGLKNTRREAGDGKPREHLHGNLSAAMLWRTPLYSFGYADGSSAVAEFSGQGIVTANGRTYANKYVLFVEPQAENHQAARIFQSRSP